MCKAEFTRVRIDHSMFVKKDDQGSAMVTIHINNMATTANNTMTLEHAIMALQWIIDLIDMKPIKWFLGMHVSRNCRLCTISLSRCLYQHCPEAIRHDWHLRCLNAVGSKYYTIHDHVTFHGETESCHAEDSIPHWCQVSHVCLNGFPSWYYFWHQQTQPIQL